MTPARYIVVMGVAGCGKSTLGQALAQALHCRFVEGDDLHPPRNVALMASGTPLTDADRADWLASLALLLGQCAARGESVVVSCSALRRRYRDQLRAACPALRLVHPHGPADVLAVRIAARADHYMPASLLDSQLAVLELPDADESVIDIDISLPVAAQCALALAALSTADKP